MKHITLLLLLSFLINHQLYSQKYIDKTSQWYEITGDYFDNSYLFINQRVEKDTILIGKEYYKMLSTYDYLFLDSFSFDTLSYEKGMHSTWYLREDDKKFYRFSNGKEYLMIDFNLKIGDSVGNGYLPQQVVSIDSFMFKGQMRKKYKTSLNKYIYEGIAGSTGITTGVNWFPGESFGVMKCYYQVGESIDFEPICCALHAMTDTCLYIEPKTTAINEIYRGNDLNVFPNPATDVLHFGQPLNNVQIFNLLGYEVAKAKQASSSISVQNLPNGMYVLKSSGRTARFIVHHE